jgi:hypothetical protein
MFALIPENLTNPMTNVTDVAYRQGVEGKEIE